MTGFKGVRLSGLSRFYHGFVFLNFAIKLCNPLHIDPYLDDIRAIQDFEAMKLFNEYSMLENPESKLYMEDPLVQDESNVIGKQTAEDVHISNFIAEIRVAPPDGFLIKHEPIE